MLGMLGTQQVDRAEAEGRGNQSIFFPDLLWGGGGERELPSWKANTLPCFPEGPVNWLGLLQPRPPGNLSTDRRVWQISRLPSPCPVAMALEGE